ncbi:peptidoglycan editing factor PgeF [Thalassorhabdus alkalitolerans]|uniref:Purine nucleoside phosphorylase n=1 Tax=Thalassorhabdus alkalitolerans TaxID=2282697 RepID=A0ABW0YIJ3_9BACI
MKHEPFQPMTSQILTIEPWKEKFTHIEAGFTSRAGGSGSGPYDSLNLALHVGEDPEKVAVNRKIIGDITGFPVNSWVASNQVHGSDIKKVSHKDAGKGSVSLEDSAGDADGLYTTEQNLFLVSFYADCVPLYFTAPKQGVIGLAHAGWRGTAANIAAEMVTLWSKEEQVKAEDIYVAIGPSIGPRAYEVDDHVVNELKKVLSPDRQSGWQETTQGKYQLDLKEVNKQLLLEAGVDEDHIVISNYCTYKEDTLFFSHRRDQGTTGRMMSFIVKTQ